MTAQQGTLGIPEGPSEGAELAPQPTPDSSGMPGDTPGPEECPPQGGPRLEALLIRVCRRQPRGLHPISLGPLVLHLQQKSHRPLSAFLRLTVGNDIPGCRAEGGWRISPPPGT